jgi:hypothetical protein
MAQELEQADVTAASIGAPGWLQRLNSARGAALLTLLAYGLAFVARLVSLGGDISRFTLASDKFIPAASARAVGLSVLTRGYGYDGQFYYLLALNPLAAHPALAGAHFDLPAYRAQRILYPLLTWALSLGGRPALVPWMLVAINLAAIAAIGALGAKLAQRLSVAPLWGATLAFYPGLLVSLLGDLAEPLAMACALGGLLCALDRRWGWTALLLSLAVLARETTALLAIALLVAGLLARLTSLRLIERERWRGAALAGLTPLVVALGWQAVLLAHWGKLGLVAAGSNNLGLPLLGLLEGVVAWHVLWPPLTQALHAVELLYLLALVELARRSLSQRLRVGWVALAWAGYALLALCLTLFVWDYYWSFLRGVIELALLSLLLLVAASPRLRRFALGATLALWLLTLLGGAPV